jgi:hypothetical protein
MSKDDKLLIMHGGLSGELDKSANSNEDTEKYIHDHTYEEIQEHHRTTPAFI